MSLKQTSSNKCFGGLQKVFEHETEAETGKCPVLYGCLSGYHQTASEHGLVIIAPDASPHGCNIKEDESWDFDIGAGFYVDATEDPWKTNYRMYSYVTEELSQLINANFPVDPQRMSISGRSRRGHRALIYALKNPGKSKSCSELGAKKDSTGYLGIDQSKWKADDATQLVKVYPGPHGQLLPDNSIAAGTEKKVIIFRLQNSYDHSYYFIVTFIMECIRHHAKYLNALKKFKTENFYRIIKL
ncbi:unnamed protein product [Nyctereutes procyonoides]|uniref:S-formylglutathione hydrolase n=1 Tax=Nyctereutes procyonoides TaxID=34880 RepID=A0A811YFW2_NYCPR|nr:unnamed protein product [Nyctereutes procyonoides]